MTDLPSLGAHARIAAIWAAPGAPLGAAGYRLPAVEGLEWHPIGAPHADNWVVTAAGAREQPGRNIVVRPGSVGNVLVYGQDACPTGRHVLQGEGNVLVFGASMPPVLHVNANITGSANLTFVGGRVTGSDFHLVNQGRGTRLVIGEDCQFGEGAGVRTSDEHALLDIDTGDLLNPAQDVLIGPHVWLQAGVAVFRGVAIGFGAVVARSSIVTGDIAAFTLAGGIPARPMRQNISWDRRRRPGADAGAAIRALARDLGAVG